MNRVRVEYASRVSEIEAYFSFVQAADTGALLLMKQDLTAQAYSPSYREDLILTFKGGLFLMLYNLMEATVKNVVEAIFDELTAKRVRYDTCRGEVRKVVLRNLRHCHNADHLKASSVTDVVDLFVDFATDAVTKTFQKKDVVSGNVDAKEIKEIADRYGFARPAADGNLLVTVKSNRNDLAHGDKSFGEVGRDYDLGRLREIKERVVHYLDVMIQNVGEYLRDQHYLTAPEHP